VLPGQTYTLDQVARILGRRRWLIVLPLVFGAAAGILAYRSLPVRYRSETLIMVTPQRIPDTYVKSTVSANVEDRLRSVSEQILSRSRLERIVQDFDLYRAQRQSGPMEDVIQRMTNDIDVKLQPNETSFRVAYVSPEPAVAQKVTERLAALFIEENLRDRENQADSTNSFLESQLQEAKVRLIDQEKKLEEYRRQYAGQLPSQLEGNLVSIQNAQMQLQALSETMNRARERRLLIERQMAEAQTQPAENVFVSAGSGSAEGAVPVSTAQQLDAARGRLEALKLRYTQDYPDVVAQEQAVRDLVARMAEEARRPAALIPEKLRSPSEVARQKRVRDFQAEIESVDRQLGSSQAEEARLKRTMAEYSGKIAVVPTRESELVELTRDYATLQATYASLLQKREDSKLAANLERRQIGEQFRILDQASRPERPFNQKQRLAALIGCPLGGLALGLAIAGLLEFRDPSFKREEDVLRVLSLPVLALIPVMGDGAAPRGPAKRLRTARAVSALLLLAGPIAALVFPTLRS
jgi:polysaccharide chain length determinant protein (PEP-CTERM system associated)